MLVVSWIPPPPPEVLAELSAIVELRNSATLDDPPTNRPPPLPELARLPEIVELVTLSVPPSIWMPPPLLAAVLFEIVLETTLADGLELRIQTPPPGPEVVRLPEIVDWVSVSGLAGPRSMPAPPAALVLPVMEVVSMVNVPPPRLIPPARLFEIVEAIIEAEFDPKSP